MLDWCAETFSPEYIDGFATINAWETVTLQ